MSYSFWSSQEKFVLSTYVEGTKLVLSLSYFYWCFRNNHWGSIRTKRRTKSPCNLLHYQEYFPYIIKLYSDWETIYCNSVCYYQIHHYITSYPIFIHTYHYAIKCLMNKPITDGRVTRWLLLWQEFDITILDKLGRENVLVDFLSRLTNDGDATPIADFFS
jgi:hypothetical protein